MAKKSTCSTVFSSLAEGHYRCTFLGHIFLGHEKDQYRMIILRKIGKPAACNVILSDPLQGVADGVNQTFTVSYEYNPGRIEIVYNGQILTSPTDFEETGPKEIKFVYLKPEDITVLAANYEIGECDYDGGGSDPDEPGATNFLALTDTPTTYSGFGNYYVKVNEAGNGLDFVLPGDGEAQEGVLNIPDGVSSTAVTFSRTFSSADYVLTVGLENKLDSEPSVYPVLIKDKTTTGFTVDFSGEIDSSNYYLNWRATLSGSGTFVGGGSGGICELSEDTTPQLAGDLEVGDNLVLLDPAPNGMSIHGYEIGHSGDASEMYVDDNPTGFACPLYIKSNGRWAACTAVSGTTQMPCVALALSEDEGPAEKILWKGIIRKGSWNWTPGDKIYVSTVEGAITNVKPNGGSWPQVIGMAIASDAIRFDPDLTTENPNS